MKRAIVSLNLLLSVLFALLLPMTASAQKDANVKAVLFYSPTCPHCRLVISETLPPLWQTYGGSIDIYRSAAATEEEAAEPPFVAFLGEQLSVLYVDVATQEGSEFFTAALDAFDLPETEGYVPTMFIDDLRLVGSGDIPAQLPGLIANGLENGGIDWPALPGIDQILSGLAFETTVLAEATPAAAGAENPEEAAAIDIETGSSVIERFKQDPLANPGSPALGDPSAVDRRNRRRRIPVLRGKQRDGGRLRAGRRLQHRTKQLLCGIPRHHSHRHDGHHWLHCHPDRVGNDAHFLRSHIRLRTHGHLHHGHVRYLVLHLPYIPGALRNRRFVRLVFGLRRSDDGDPGHERETSSACVCQNPQSDNQAQLAFHTSRHTSENTSTDPGS
ncbi:MAG: DsbA family protein [Anaerolineales bacterium]